MIDGVDAITYKDTPEEITHTIQMHQLQYPPFDNISYNETIVWYISHQYEYGNRAPPQPATIQVQIAS